MSIAKHEIALRQKPQVHSTLFSASLLSMTSVVKMKNLKILPDEYCVVETCGKVRHSVESHVKCDCLID